MSADSPGHSGIRFGGNQEFHNDIQGWLYPLAFAVSIPSLVYSAYHESRFSLIDFDPNEDRTVSFEVIVATCLHVDFQTLVSVSQFCV